MSGEDEMRAQKITFILCIELSLKTSLNSGPSGEHRVACLGITVTFMFLRIPISSVKNSDMSKPRSLTQVGTGQSICQMSSSSSFTSRGHMCSSIV